MRVLGIDIGVWTFSICEVDGNQVKSWKTLSLPKEAGFTHARQLVSFHEIPQSVLIEVTFDALSRLFPPERVRHDFDVISIESQPRKKGQASKMVEVSMAVYRYFRECCTPERLCCWRFPDVYLVSAASKFTKQTMFGVNMPGIKTKYEQRKNYATRMASLMVSPDAPFLKVPDELVKIFLGMDKPDDMADALLMAGLGIKPR